MTAEKRSFPMASTVILGVLMAIGLVLVVIRFAYGLGAVTNLTDGRAWGLWISFDLYCGVALAAGGFTLAGAVYVFNLKKYYPIVRSAILTAFLGYVLVILALLVDLGQPWRIWHMIIYWNPHSPLFEVGWCVLLYTTVLALEFSPSLFERFNLQAPLRVIRAIQIPLVIAGIVLSTLHQSSLGSILLLMPDKIHPLWFTPILPILFLLSAISVGLAMVIAETSLAGKGLGHHVDLDILAGLGRALPYILGPAVRATQSASALLERAAGCFRTGAQPLQREPDGPGPTSGNGLFSPRDRVCRLNRRCLCRRLGLYHGRPLPAHRS